MASEGIQLHRFAGSGGDAGFGGSVMHSVLWVLSREEVTFIVMTNGSLLDFIH